MWPCIVENDDRTCSGIDAKVRGCDFVSKYDKEVLYGLGRDGVLTNLDVDETTSGRGSDYCETSLNWLVVDHWWLSYLRPAVVSYHTFVYGTLIHEDEILAVDTTGGSDASAGDLP